MMTLEVGPLVREALPSPDATLTSDRAIIEHVAFVQMRGRYAYCRNPRGWYRHNSREWLRTDTDTVRSALRRACDELYESLREVSPGCAADQRRLIDLNWVFRQVDVVRAAVTVPAGRLGVGHE